MIKDGEMGLFGETPLNCGSCKKLEVAQLSRLSLSLCLPPVSVFLCGFFSPLPDPPMPEAHNACWSPEEYGISSAPKRKDNKTTSRQWEGD